jgi:hypothetical protein
VLAAFSAAAFASAPSIVAAQTDEFTGDFRLEECRFRTKGDNPYFPLRPGRLVYEGEEDGETERLEITITRDFERIWVPGLGSVKTRVLVERETVDDELREISRNFFAVCGGRNDVVYFGEDVDIFHPNGQITHEGAWRAGLPDADGVAEPGIIMPGTFLLGSRYDQEIAEGIALDRAEHVEMGLLVETPAGTFRDCVRVVETTPLEPDSESEKVYCPGVGLVMDNDLTLIEYDFGRGGKEGDDKDDDDASD